MNGSTTAHSPAPPPVPALWRTLTYGGLQPMRIREAVLVPVQPQVPL
jgi:hypothetical protein